MNISFPFCFWFLQKLKIGMAVGKIRKHQNDELSSAATKLVAKWKKLYADMKTRRDNGSNKTNEATTRKVLANGSKERRKEEKKDQPTTDNEKKVQDSAKPPPSPTRPAEPVNINVKLPSDPVRAKVITMLTEAFGQKAHSGNPATTITSKRNYVMK